MSSDDPRLGCRIEISPWPPTPSREGRSLAILGFPCDEGVGRNGGVVGAKGGPAAFRAAVRSIGPLRNPELPLADLNRVEILDVGDVGVVGKENLELEDCHRVLGQRVKDLVNSGFVPFVVGGGNDQSYPNACGLLDAVNSKISVVNIDAHLDVRPRKLGKVHSGSPFRELIQDERFRAGSKFRVFAAQGSQCSQKHVDWLMEQTHVDCGIIWLLTDIRAKNQDAAEKFEELLGLLADGGNDIFVSFDLDSISGADCPGVSCPAVYGLSALEALKICYLAGKHPKVRLFDCSEFNPEVEHKRTARLLANMFYFFALGFSERETNS